YYENYLKLNSTNCSVWGSLANCYIGMNMSDETMKYARKALQYYNTYAIGLDMLGRSYLSKRDFDNAMATFNLLNKERPNYYLAYYFQAICLYEKKDYLNALKKADTCISYKNDFKPLFK